MANYVTYYNGQRVEITQARLAQFLAGNPGDIGRVGSAFYNDSDNLALHPATVAPEDHATAAVSQPAASYAPPAAYAPPATVLQAGPAGLVTQADPVMDARIVASSAPMPAERGGSSAPIVNVNAGSPAASPFGSIPTWAIIAAAVVVLLILIRE